MVLTFISSGGGNPKKRDFQGEGPLPPHHRPRNNRRAKICSVRPTSIVPSILTITPISSFVTLSSTPPSSIPSTFPSFVHPSSIKPSSFVLSAPSAAPSVPSLPESPPISDAVSSLEKFVYKGTDCQLSTAIIPLGHLQISSRPGGGDIFEVCAGYCLSVDGCASFIASQDNDACFA